MKTSERAWRAGRDFAGVLPRAFSALRDDGWNPLSPSGLRLLGEVTMDEVALSGMTLTAPPPTLDRTVDACAAAADELSALSVARAHAEPEPLQVKAIRRQRFGPLVYERLTFDREVAMRPLREEEAALPQAELAGPGHPLQGARAAARGAPAGPSGALLALERHAAKVA